MKFLDTPSADMTHVGWFWFCPVYLGGITENDLIVEARAAWLEPLFCIAEYFETARLLIGTAINPEYPETFMFRVTGEVKRDGVEL